MWYTRAGEGNVSPKVLFDRKLLGWDFQSPWSFFTLEPDAGELGIGYDHALAFLGNVPQ